MNKPTIKTSEYENVDEAIKAIGGINCILYIDTAFNKLEKPFPPNCEVRFAPELEIETFYPEWWGAKGLDFGDDRDAINNAIKSAMDSEKNTNVLLIPEREEK